MSTLRISMGVQVLDFGPLNRGHISIRYNDGNRDYDLILRLTTGISTTGYFTEVAYVNGNSGENEDQAINYRNAFNRDYFQVGKQPGDVGKFNLIANVDGSDVVITALRGTFNQANCIYTGNVLTGVSFIANNTVQQAPLAMVIVRDSTGDCSNVDHSIVASGGTGPYTLNILGVNVLTGWDGSETIQPFPRGANVKVVLTDSASGELIKYQLSPRPLTASEFNVTQTQGVGTADLLIEWLNPVNNLGPISYALEPQGSVSGDVFYTSNTFAGIFPGIYELFIKDYYGCTVKKTLIVSQISDPSMAVPPSYFEVMHGNAVIFSEAADYGKRVKKHFGNTLSHTELAPIAYQVAEKFDPTDEIAVQFKSSYPFHVVTLHLVSGAKRNIDPVTIQTNMGIQERVDCMTFPIESGGVGVYFDGGDEYAPGTDTVIGPSEHTTFLPYWVAEGQIVNIDGLGNMVIQGTGYDSILQKDYFIVNATIPAQAASRVQVTYNKQLYNLFEFRFSLADGEVGRIVIEKGQDFNNIVGNPWTSELLVGREDVENDLLIEWSDVKNRGGLVFQSNIKFLRRMEGKFRPSFRGDSETADGDSRAYSLYQSAYLEYVLSLEGISAKEAYQMCIASGLGGFLVNGVPLVRSEFPQVEELGSSNLFNFSCKFSTGGDDLSIQGDEVVLDVSTGVEGGGSSAKEPYTLPLYDSRVRLVSQGGFVTVNGDFIAIE